ncbi:hypothetical protein JCM10450v2_000567 [Rhodotorula kratochvilovae]
MLRTVLQSTARTVQATPACSSWREFSCAAVRAAPAPASSPAGSAPAGAASGTDALLDLLGEVDKDSPAAAQELADQTSILRHLSRNQVISPQHLSPRHLLVPYLPRPNFAQAHPLGPPTSCAESHDPFVRYGLDPLRDATTNPFVLSEFVTSMGKIKNRGKTGLQRKSQRRIGKAVRRARSMGIIPTFGISVPGGQY